MNLNSPISQGGRIFKIYASRLEKLGILTFGDFLWHLPTRYEDYSAVTKISEIRPGETVTVQGKVLEIKNQYIKGRKIKTIQKAVISDDTGEVGLVWFNQPYLAKSIAQDAMISASGKADLVGRKLSITSPAYEVFYSGDTKNVHTGRLTPVYPETKGISSKWLRRQIFGLLAQKNEFREYLPDFLREKYRLMDYAEAIKKIHFPEDLETAEKARERLAFDELFLMQLAASKRRAAWRADQKKTPFKKFEPEIEKLISSLPFKLTTAQREAVEQILHDFSEDKPMNRLLQGDVGSGKTIVAAIAMYAAYLNGYQSVLMAPTEILAEQHYASISKLLSAFKVKVDLITGSKNSIKDKAASTKSSKYKVSSIKQKEKVLNSAKYSLLNTDILIGTHAVLNEKIEFKNLGFVAIDEQQRFGVKQRGLIRKRGENPHLLTMTATPIPRTVALTMYGELDLSYLYEMPTGRKKVKTWLVPPEKRDGAYEWIKKRVVEDNSQAFIICPFIEQSESMMTVKAASKEYERLTKEIYPGLKLGLLHGKLKGKEKESVLEDFRKKKFDILVATPVVEVGIDIPNATVIMIEASERFGLAQLHQLRGRVGRGEKQSYCLLFAETQSPITMQRLRSMETMYSGAELAEVDLRMRGPGNLYGTAQHGIPTLKVASFSDTKLIQVAKNAADEIFRDLPKYPMLEIKLEEADVQEVSPD